MNRNIFSNTLLFALILSVCLSSCVGKEIFIDPGSIILSKSELTLLIGTEETLVVTIEPNLTENEYVTWNSSRNSIATVDQNGKVTAVGVGTATITATIANSITATCAVIVEGKPVTSVELNKTSLNLTVGNIELLTASVKPDDATNKNVTWNSSRNSIATVDQNGKVTAVAVGSATITVTTVDGDRTATCNVTVTASQPIGNNLVVAYTYSSPNSNIMRWNYLTHINVAFLYPLRDGTLNTTGVRSIRTLIGEAHRHNVKILVSTSHSNSTVGQYAAAVSNNPETLADNLWKYAVDNNLDGIDIDFEDWNGTSGSARKTLEAKVVAFAKIMHEKKPANMLLTCAVTAYDQGYTDKWHEYFDIINVMTYDYHGPWAGEGDLAPYDWAIQSIQRWNRENKAPMSKLTLGVPFYGYSWNPGDKTDYSYQEILNKYPTGDVPNNDKIDQLYYNGKATIVRKTDWAKANGVGGIMIWNLEQDATADSNSLLKAIGDILRP